MQFFACVLAHFIPDQGHPGCWVCLQHLGRKVLMLLLCHKEHKAAIRNPLPCGFFPFAPLHLAAEPFRVAPTPDLLQPGSHPHLHPQAALSGLPVTSVLFPQWSVGLGPISVCLLLAARDRHQSPLSCVPGCSLLLDFRQQLSFPSIRAPSPGDCPRPDVLLQPCSPSAPWCLLGYYIATADLMCIKQTAALLQASTHSPV